MIEYGLEFDEMVDLADLRIDHIAAHVLTTMVAVDEWDTAYRAMCNAYTQIANDRECSPAVFLRTQRGRTYIECRISEELDEVGYPKAPTISGSITQDEGTMISANKVLFRGLPQAVLEAIKAGDALGEYIEMLTMKERKIKSVECMNGEMIARLEPLEPVQWTLISPFGEGFRTD